MTGYERTLLFEYRVSSAVNWLLLVAGLVYCAVVQATDVTWDWTLVFIFLVFGVVTGSYEDTVHKKLEKIHEERTA